MSTRSRGKPVLACVTAISTRQCQQVLPRLMGNAKIGGQKGIRYGAVDEFVDEIAIISAIAEVAHMGFPVDIPEKRREMQVLAVIVVVDMSTEQTRADLLQGLQSSVTVSASSMTERNGLDRKALSLYTSASFARTGALPPRRARRNHTDPRRLSRRSKRCSHVCRLSRYARL